MTLKAIIFDVDGTLADTEDAHRVAFNQAFADNGYNIAVSSYVEQEDTIVADLEGEQA